VTGDSRMAAYSWLRRRPLSVDALFAVALAALVLGLADAFPADVSDIAAWLPEMFWPLWSLSLATATYAYWLRRRGQS